MAHARLNSLDRFALVLFPLWMVAGKWLAERRRFLPTLVGCGALLFVFSLQFALVVHRLISADSAKGRPSPTITPARVSVIDV